jgi:hypothetical protein
LSKSIVLRQFFQSAVIVEEEASVVRRIFEQYAAGRRQVSARPAGAHAAEISAPGANSTLKKQGFQLRELAAVTPKVQSTQIEWLLKPTDPGPWPRIFAFA